MPTTSITRWPSISPAWSIPFITAQGQPSPAPRPWGMPANTWIRIIRTGSWKERPHDRPAPPGPTLPAARRGRLYAHGNHGGHDHHRDHLVGPDQQHHAVLCGLPEVIQAHAGDANGP